MLHARPEPSHSGRFAFNCALPLSSGPFRRPVKALLALKEDFSEYARPGRRRCHVYDGRGFQRSGQVGARKMDATGRIRGTTRVSRGKRGTVYCVRFERGGGERVGHRPLTGPRLGGPLRGETFLLFN